MEPQEVACLGGFGRARKDSNLRPSELVSALDPVVIWAGFCGCHMPSATSNPLTIVIYPQ